MMTVRASDGINFSSVISSQMLDS